MYLSALQAPPARVELLTDGAHPADAALIAAGRVTGRTSLSALRARETSVMVWFGRLTKGLGWP